MLKFLLAFFIIFSSAFSQEKDIPPEVSLRMYIGALIAHHSLSIDSKYSSYYNSYVIPISRSAAYSETYNNIFSYQRSKGKGFLTAKIIYGAYRNMLSTDELLILVNLSIHEKEDQEFINLVSQSYVSRMDNVLFINDSIDNSSSANTKYIKYSTSSPIVFGDDLEVSFSPGSGQSIDISGNHRKYTDIFKHCFRQIVKNYKVDDYKVKITWKRVKDKPSFVRTPLEIFMVLANPDKDMKQTTYFGDFSHTGKVRSWGLIRENFKRFIEQRNGVAYIPVDDIQDLKEISLLYGKSSVISKQIIGVETLDEFIETDGKDIKPESMFLYQDTLDKIRKGQLKGPAIINSLDKILKIQPNHLSAQLYKDLLQKKYVTRLSLMNSFFEFEILFNRFKNKGLFTENKNPVVANLSDIEEETQKLFRVADRRVVAMCKSLLDIMKTVKLNETASNKSIQKGIRQKYFKNLRTINLQRDLLIDNQAAIDRIYKK